MEAKGQQLEFRAVDFGPALWTGRVADSLAWRGSSPSAQHRRPLHGHIEETKMNADTIWQLIRYVLIAAGGYIVGKGWASETQWEAVIGTRWHRPAGAVGFLCQMEHQAGTRTRWLSGKTSRP